MGHLTYQQAVVRYCPDLRNPHVTSVPVAVVAVGSDGGDPFACVVGWPARRLKLDAVAKEILADVPRFLRTQIDREMAGLGDEFAPKFVLTGLHHALRNSVHVSEIGEPVVIEDSALHGDRGVLEVMRRTFDRLAELTFKGGYQHVVVLDAPPTKEKAPTPEATMWHLAACA